MSLDSDVAALKASILARPPNPDGTKRGSGSSETKANGSESAIKRDDQNHGGNASGSTSGAADQPAPTPRAEGALEEDFKRKERMLREKMRSEFGKIQNKQQQLEEVRRWVDPHSPHMLQPSSWINIPNTTEPGE